MCVCALPVNVAHVVDVVKGFENAHQNVSDSQLTQAIPEVDVE